MRYLGSSEIDSHEYCLCFTMSSRMSLCIQEMDSNRRSKLEDLDFDLDLQSLVMRNSRMVGDFLSR